MGEGKTNMFGKTYNTIGSTDSNFLIKTKGDLKVQWGGKFIDIIKNGKLASAGADILKVAASSDEISSNGIYLVPTEEGNEIWISIDGTKILLNTTGEQYISFLEEQKLTSEQKNTALANIGFNYETLQEAKDANIKAGIIFVKELNQLFLVNDGKITQYQISSNGAKDSDKFTKLTIGDIEIFESFIRATEQLNIGIGNNTYVTLQYGKVQINGDLIINSGSIQSVGATSESGFRLYNQDSKSILEIDRLIARESISAPNEYIDVTVQEFRTLVQEFALQKGKQYRLYNFRNFWELFQMEVLEEDATVDVPSNVHPLIITAKNSYEYYREQCFFHDDINCIITYDVDYNKTYTFNGEVVESLGLITHMKDKNNNQCNYNFRHLRFLKDGSWNYTFGGANQDQIDQFSNNKIILSNIRIETLVDGQIVTLEDLENYAILQSPCNDNVFADQKSPLYIEKNFNNNTILGNWDAQLLEGVVINCLFKKDVVSININSNLEDCTFDFLIENTDLFQDASLSFKNCQFKSTVSGDIESPDNEIRKAIQSEEMKQVTVYTSDGTKKLKVLSDSLILIPSGAIIMWHGTEIPYGWAVCDGTNGTPNLIGKFVKAVAAVDQIGDNPSELNENNELTLAQEHLPKHSHPHKEHTHSLDGNISGTTGSSGDLTVSLDYSDYNWGIEGVTKTFVTSVAGEGVTTESGTVDGVSNIKTQGGNATGGSHTHSISLDTDGGVSLSSTKSQEEELVDSEWPNNSIKIEPRSYSLIFIMKL